MSIEIDDPIFTKELYIDENGKLELYSIDEVKDTKIVDYYAHMTRPATQYIIKGNQYYKNTWEKKDRRHIFTPCTVYDVYKNGRI